MIDVAFGMTIHSPLAVSSSYKKITDGGVFAWIEVPNSSSPTARGSEVQHLRVSSKSSVQSDETGFHEKMSTSTWIPHAAARALLVLCRAVKSAWRAAYVAFVAEMQSTARLDMPSTTDAPSAEKPKLTIHLPPDSGIGNRRSSGVVRAYPRRLAASPVLAKQSSTGSIADRSSDTALGARRPEWTSLDHKDTNPHQRRLMPPLKTEMLSQQASFGRSPSSTPRSPRFSMVTFASPMEQAMTLLRRAALPSSSSMDSSSVNVKKLLDEAIELLGIVTSTASSAALGASSLTKVDVASELARHVKETGGEDLDSDSEDWECPP